MLSTGCRSFNTRPVQSASKNPSLLRDMEHRVRAACWKRLTDRIYSKLAISICQEGKISPEPEQ